MTYLSGKELRAIEDGEISFQTQQNL